MHNYTRPHPRWGRLRESSEFRVPSSEGSGFRVSSRWRVPSCEFPQGSTTSAAQVAAPASVRERPSVIEASLQLVSRGKGQRAGTAGADVPRPPGPRNLKPQSQNPGSRRRRATTEPPRQGTSEDAYPTLGTRNSKLETLRPRVGTCGKAYPAGPGENRPARSGGSDHRGSRCCGTRPSI